MDDARIRWERRWDWPLTIIAAAFLVAYAWPILQPDLALAVKRALTGVAWLTWAVFAFDYVMRLHLSRDRRQFVRTSVLDLVVIVLPVLRPLRMLRLVTMLGALNRGVAASVRGRVAVYVVGATSLVIFCAALAVLEAERTNPEANIRTFGDALWWAATTVTTVGYGDRYPTTGQGRVVAGLLMVGGIALLGMVTAALASWLLDRVREVEEEGQAATRRDIQALSRQIAELQAELQARQGSTQDPAADGVTS